MTNRLLSVLGVLTVVSGGAWAATLTVDTIDPGVAADGWCSLIEAIDNANADTAVHADCAAGAGADVIELGVGLTYTLVAAHIPRNGLPQITSGITVNGHGSSIVRDPSAPDEFRIVNVAKNGDLTLNDLSLSNGLLTGATGGGISNVGSLTLDRCTISMHNAYLCGGIDNYGGTVVMTDSEVSQNTALTTFGGGLCNRAYSDDATMTLTRSQITENEAKGTSGNLGGGGIVTAAGSGRTAALTLTQCSVSENTAPSVAGILQNFTGTYTNAHSTLLIDRCVISNNRNNLAAGIPAGAGVLSFGEAGLETVTEIRNTLIAENEGLVGAGVEAWRGVQLTIRDSTVRDNQAQDSGGGILVGNQTHLHLERSAVCDNRVEGGVDIWAGGIGVVDATAFIANSTISGNFSAGTVGGVGAYSALTWGGHGAVVEISDSTIFDNTVGNIGGGGGIGAARKSGVGEVDVILSNSIVAANHEQNGAVLGNCFIDGTATLASLGFNLADDSTCPLVHPDDLIVPDAMLSTLGDHGGATPCHPPLVGSPVIDSGDDANCPDTDQLGHLRPWDGDGDDLAHCDRGAVEFGAPLFVDGFETGTTDAWSYTLP